MNVRHFALAIGLVYLAIGILGFVPGAHMHPPIGAPDLAVDAQYGYLFGLFPVNVLHNIVHLIVGGLGLYASQRAAAAVNYSRGLAIFYGILAVMGLVPGLGTTFGLIPIFGHDVWLHAVTAAAAAYFGWVTHGVAGPVGHAPRHA